MKNLANHDGQWSNARHRATEKWSCWVFDYHGRNFLTLVSTVGKLNKQYPIYCKMLPAWDEQMFFYNVFGPKIGNTSNYYGWKQP